MNAVGVWQLAALVGIGTAFAALLVALRVRQRVGEVERTTASVQKDLRALCNAAVTMGERMNTVELRLKQVAQRQDELGLRQEQLDYAAPQERSFQQAIKLVQKGARVEEVMEICDLTRGEAELIAMMHRLGPGA